MLELWQTPFLPPNHRHTRQGCTKPPSFLGLRMAAEQMPGILHCRHGRN
jgi:hypothetical protein